MISHHQASPDKLRQQLKDFLSSCSSIELLEAFQAAWLNKIIPGLDRLAGCDQGSLMHLEGNVAVHTALVFKNMSTVAQVRLQRSPDFIERLSVLIHDLHKPSTRCPQTNGGVSFPNHEARAAEDVAAIAKRIGLSDQETERLYFIVARHGDAHSILDLTAAQLNELRDSPWIKSLALLQEADARSCILADGGHLAVYWDQLIADGAAPVPPVYQ